MNKFFFLIIFAFFCSPVNAQVNSINNFPTDSSGTFDSTTILKIRAILISGNKKTKDYIINREIHLKPGDTIAANRLLTETEVSRQQVHNTTLFSEVKIDPVISLENEVTLHVTVKEKWYLYPVPLFQLVDRNLNEWIVKYKGDLGRVNYGMKFVHYNLSGRRDQLRIYLINGYTRNVSISYVNPYSNSKLTQGFSVGGGFSQFREITFRTKYDNSLERYNTGKFIYNSWNLHAGYIIRKAIRKRHIFSIGFSHVNNRDSGVVKLNPNYFNDSSSQQNIVDLAYSFQYVDLDNVLYPTKGFSGFIALTKRGLGWSGGINMLGMEAEANKYLDLGKKWYASFQLNGRIKLPFEQAYINQRAFGYGNTYLRGLEYFAIDAVAALMAKLNLKKEIARFHIRTPLKKSASFNRIPFRILAKTYTDFGYAYNKPGNLSRLNNKFLYTGGFGLDVITLYDIQLRFEYSFNQLGQNGLFLHNQSGF